MFNLAGNCEIISGAQSLAGKIFCLKNLAERQSPATTTLGDGILLLFKACAQGQMSHRWAVENSRGPLEKPVPKQFLADRGALFRLYQAKLFPEKACNIRPFETSLSQARLGPSTFLTAFCFRELQFEVSARLMKVIDSGSARQRRLCRYWLPTPLRNCLPC